MKMSSESMPSPQTARVDCQRGRIMLRTPTSAEIARASGVTRSAGSPVTGSRVMVAPRASLEWKP